MERQHGSYPSTYALHGNKTQSQICKSEIQKDGIFHNRQFFRYLIAFSIINLCRVLKKSFVN